MRGACSRRALPVAVRFPPQPGFDAGRGHDQRQPIADPRGFAADLFRVDPRLRVFRACEGGVIPHERRRREGRDLPSEQRGRLREEEGRSRHALRSCGMTIHRGSARIFRGSPRIFSAWIRDQAFPLRAEYRLRYESAAKWHMRGRGRERRRAPRGPGADVSRRGSIAASSPGREGTAPPDGVRAHAEPREGSVSAGPSLRLRSGQALRSGRRTITASAESSADAGSARRTRSGVAGFRCRP